ncbi:MAG: exonuclease domain-containing protein [Christensenellaceae bacterium]
MNAELLSEIANLHNGTIKYRGATYYKSSKLLELSFISDVAPEADEEIAIADSSKSYAPDFVKDIKVKIEKIITLPEFVKRAFFDYVKENHAFCYSDLPQDCVDVEIDGLKVTVEIKVARSIYNFFSVKNVAAELKKYFESRFIEDFSVSLIECGVDVVDENAFETKLTDNEKHIKSIRTLKVDSVTRLFDNDATDTAYYMVDVKDYLGSLYLAGVVRSIRELKTKSDKPYFIIDFSDRTATVSGTVFPTKATLSKVQKLQENSEIIARCEYLVRNGYHNLRINGINLCCFPKNFVPVPRPKRKVPDEYSLVFPQKLVLEKQDNFLVDNSVPECLLGRTFVVFDLETTGKELDDKITEIGAVKMVDGKITEYFETLVNPLKHIPQEIVELTGISDDTVKDAPVFENVCSDFYKFCYGATLVAHNIEFDSRFIRKQSAPLDFVYDNPEVDTLALARQSIYGVSNYKLNTLCDKFGIKFNHHRAYSDALACAKLLVEIARIKKSVD